jgi:putative transposase
MKTGRPKAPVVLSEEHQQQLRSWAASRSLPHGLVTRARIVLLAAEGLTNQAIAEKVGLSKPMVGKWRQCYLEHGLTGLHDEMRPGRPRSVSDEEVAALLRKTLQSKPKGATHWSVRSMAEHTQISRPTVHRIWSAFGLQPHRQRHFKLSTDPFFVEKVRDIVGLYLNPPDKAMVLCVDEKSQIQALDRTQPSLPMGIGYVEGLTHDYVRHGTTTLFAALNIATGQVLTACKRRHRHQEYLGFLKRLDANVPAGMDVHLVVDNYSTHKHPADQRWLAARPRYQVHYTHVCLLVQQVEIWSHTQRAIRRERSKVSSNSSPGSTVVQHYNSRCGLFLTVRRVDPEKIKRLCQYISETRH